MEDTISVFGTDYEQPIAVEKITRKWVTFETEDGLDFNDFLIYLFNNSSVNNAIITGVSNLIFGEGLLFEGSTAQVTKANELFKANDVRRVCSDFKLFNKYAFFVTWNRTGSRVVKVEHCPVNNIRLSEDGGYWYSDRWDLYRKPQYRPEHYGEFGGENKDRTQILFYQPYFPGNQFYSLPDYNGSLSWINLDIEIGKFHNANIENGLAPGMLLNFNNGEPDEETRKKIEAKVRQKWQGSNKAGKVVIAFNKTKEQAAEVTPIGVSDLDKQFQFLTEQSPLQILTGHRITSPILFGIKSDSGLGSNADEIKQSFELLNETVIAPYQHQIINTIEELLTPSGLTGVGVEFIPFVPQFGENELEEGDKVGDLADILGSLSPLVATKVLENMTEEEIRNIVKLPPATGPVSGAPSPGAFSALDYPTEEQMINFMEALPYETLKEHYPSSAWVEVHKDESVEFHQLQAYQTHLAEFTPKQKEQNKETEQAIKETNPDGRLHSRLDGNSYSTRFVYKGGAIKETSRAFCRSLFGNQKGRHWRIEDISKMSLSGVNKLIGNKYSIFELKGLWNCQHFWEMVIIQRRVQNPEPVPSKSEIVNSDPFLSRTWDSANELNSKLPSGTVTRKSGYKRKT